MELPLGGRRTHLTELMYIDLDCMPVAVADHCYGCTAGQGSGCSGALCCPDDNDPELVVLLPQVILEK
jgi:hypothetical protein